MFAYVLYSLYAHGVRGSPPADRPVVALVVGAVLPDLIDKPLAWQFDVFQTGYAVAHSAFVAVPVALAAYGVARRFDAGPTGAAFGVGYLLHLVGDVLPASLSEGTLTLTPALWPVLVAPPDVRESLAGGAYALLTLYVAQILSLDLTLVVVLQVGSLVAGLALWLVDGRPGLALLTDPIRAVIRRSRG